MATASLLSVCHLRRIVPAANGVDVLLVHVSPAAEDASLCELCLSMFVPADHHLHE